MPLKHAAMLAGVSYDSLNRRRNKGDSELAPIQFRDFCKALHHAEAVAMQRLLSLISNAGQTDWKAAAWTLERRFPDEFSKPQKLEHSGPEGKPIHALTTVEPEVLQRMKKQSGMQELAMKFATSVINSTLLAAQLVARESREKTRKKCPFRAFSRFSRANL